MPLKKYNLFYINNQEGDMMIQVFKNNFLYFIHKYKIK
jgi:hypothetical protein